MLTRLGRLPWNGCEDRNPKNAVHVRRSLERRVKVLGNKCQAEAREKGEKKAQDKKHERTVSGQNRHNRWHGHGDVGDMAAVHRIRTALLLALGEIEQIGLFVRFGFAQEILLLDSLLIERDSLDLHVANGLTQGRSTGLLGGKISSCLC